MDISVRREEILKRVVNEYIKTALPISSEWLQNEWFCDVSPATVRIDLAELTLEGFLEKPYVSGGRVPTDKGYRFFVDNLPTSTKAKTAKLSSALSRQKNLFRLAQEVVKVLSQHSNNLALVYLNGFDMLLQDGWNRLVREPEFNSVNYLREFSNGLDELIDYFPELAKNERLQTRVFIGQESPLKKHNFSFIFANSKIGENSLFLALAGPRRMDFGRNLKLIEDLISLFN